MRRIVGLTVPFKESNNLHDFCEDVLDHFIKHGLETFSYLPDISEPTVMRSIITEHPQFTTSLQQSLKLSVDLSVKCDLFDMEDSVAATEFLLAFLDPELTHQVKGISETGDTFAATWLRLIYVLVSISSRHHDDIRAKSGHALQPVILRRILRS